MISGTAWAPSQARLPKLYVETALPAGASSARMSRTGSRPALYLHPLLSPNMRRKQIDIRIPGKISELYQSKSPVFEVGTQAQATALKLTDLHTHGSAQGPRLQAPTSLNELPTVNPHKAARACGGHKRKVPHQALTGISRLALLCPPQGSDFPRMGIFNGWPGPTSPKSHRILEGPISNPDIYLFSINYPKNVDAPFALSRAE